MRRIDFSCKIGASENNWRKMEIKLAM